MYYARTSWNWITFGANKARWLGANVKKKNTSSNQQRERASGGERQRREGLSLGEGAGGSRIEAQFGTPWRSTRWGTRSGAWGPWRGWARWGGIGSGAAPRGPGRSARRTRAASSAAATRSPRGGSPAPTGRCTWSPTATNHTVSTFLLVFYRQVLFLRVSSVFF